MPWTVRVAYQKLSIPSAFPGDSCPNMGPVAFWVISSSVIMTLKFCFCCSQKPLHRGRGAEGRLEKNAKDTGSRKSHSMWREGHGWVSYGESRHRA